MPNVRNMHTIKGKSIRMSNVHMVVFWASVWVIQNPSPPKEIIIKYWCPFLLLWCATVASRILSLTLRNQWAWADPSDISIHSAHSSDRFFAFPFISRFLSIVFSPYQLFLCSSLIASRRGPYYLPTSSSLLSPFFPLLLYSLLKLHALLAARLYSTYSPIYSACFAEFT